LKQKLTLNRNKSSIVNNDNNTVSGASIQ